MTTKPKAKKYRIRRSEFSPPATPTEAAKPAPSNSPAAPSSKAAAPVTPAATPEIMVEDLFSPSATDDGFGSQTFPTKNPSAAEPAPKAPKAEAATPASIPDAIDGIKREGLTGRQLRMARRVAQKQGLSPTSDFDAVRLLRDQGIDPFKQSNMLEVVTSQKSTSQMGQPGQTIAQITPVQVPSTQVQQPALPSTQVLSATQRGQDVMQIQKDIARRRRRRATLLAIRLAIFVLLPTFVAGYYYYAVATPMYATKSEFVIQQADSAGGGGLGSGLLSGTGLANSQDSIAVQGYLQSRDAMLRLDGDLNFKSHFSQTQIDDIQRLDTEATNEAAYKVFQKRVRIGYDPTEGILKMEVAAADPAVSADFSKKLLAYAEERVDQLSLRKRDDQLAGADASRQEANEKMRAAQERIVEIQEKLGVISPESEVQAIFGQITQLESELLTERLSLAQFRANPRPSAAKVSASENKIAELESLISEKRSELTESTSGADSIARVSGELLVAQTDLATRQELLAQAEGAYEAARLEANRQVRYLSVAVSPVAPDEPTYPRAFENTILAFLIFSGIYLMVSLTSSILREQV